MQRMLIVDDETIICDGLYEIISRETSLNLDIYKCYSAYEAMQLLQQYRFDVVLTDIQMPGMTGLQLADFTRNKWPKCRIIFLTGHHEFDYVYSAISYERVNYILKTEGYDKVIDAVKYAIDDTLKVNEIDKYIEDQQILQQEAIKQQFLKELVNGNLPISDVNKESFAQLKLNLNTSIPLLVLVAQFNIKSNQLSFAERTKIKYEVKWIADHYFNEFPINSEVLLTNNEIIWLLQPQSHLDFIGLINITKSHLDTLQDTLLKQCDIGISFVLDKEEIYWQQLSSRIEQLKVLFQYRYGREDHSIIFTTNEINEEQQQLLLKQGASLKKIAQLDKMLQQSLIVEFEQQLEIVLDQMLHVEQESISEEIYLHTAMVYFTYINKWNINAEVNKKISLAQLLHFNTHTSKLDAANYLRNVGGILLSLQLEAQDKRAVTVIEKLSKYIHDHIFMPDKLTLVHLSEITYFNTSYLSRLFKQIMGRNLSDYIVEVKMQQAEQLLKDSQNKIQDVAERLGYSNATNFTRVFKKQFGMTPQEFRTTHSI